MARTVRGAAAPPMRQMKQQIVLESFSACSYEVMARRPGVSGPISLPVGDPRPQPRVERAGQGLGIERGEAPLRGACVRTLPARLESTLLNQRLAAGRTQPTPPPPADIPRPRDSAGGPFEREIP